MKLRWDRESFLVSLIAVMILFALGYYGYSNLVEPIKLSAESSSRIIEDQRSLLEAYPPELSALEARQEEYEETTAFIPDSEAINEALVIIETSANNHDVSIHAMHRVQDQQPIDGVSGDYVQSTYQVEIQSESINAIRSLIASLMNEDRLWSVTSLNITKQGEANFSANFMIEIMYRSAS